MKHILGFKTMNFSNTNACMSVKLYSTKQWEEENVLFTNTLNTYYLVILHETWHMVKDNGDSQRGNPLPPPFNLVLTFRASCYSARLSWAHTPVIN